MIRLRNKSRCSQNSFFRHNIEKLGECYYIHYDQFFQTLSIRGKNGMLTLYINAGTEINPNRRIARIENSLKHFGASIGTIKLLSGSKRYLSWLYTLGQHRHVKIAKRPGFRFWPSDIKKIVGIKGTYASP